MRSEEKKKEKRRGGGREGLLRKQNSRPETHTETQNRTGTHTPTEKHANTQALLTSRAPLPRAQPCPALPRAARLRPVTAQLPVLSQQFRRPVASGNPLTGPQFPHLSHEETPQAHFTRLAGRMRSPLCKKPGEARGHREAPLLRSSPPSAGLCLWPVPSQVRPG